MARYARTGNNYALKQKFYHKRVWKDLRQWYLRQEPLCEMCKEAGKLTPAHSIDHKIPFEDPTDPLAVDSNNLKSLCLECHSVVTAREQKRTVDSFPSPNEFFQYKYKPRIEYSLDGFPLS